MTPNPDAPPREPRSSRVVLARMRSARLACHDVIIRNMSTHGLCLRSRGLPPMQGESVTIEIGNMRKVAGTVRWVRGTSFGVALAEALDPAAFSFADKSWDNVHRDFGSGHVFDQFRPESSTWRPSLRPR